ncbi:juvenile hormone esterase-like [Colletes gigas]|uniref:juvenile hormone esterase-like n=1 Tax=Colletes gigas TaxID=935657 RepID=UPI001C9A8F0A|nr:juvenile hormone esterase-like [Colletes gigas]
MACTSPVVTVKQGQLRGVVDENIYGGQLLAFRGIPYAKPPIGPFRFKDCLPPEPWTGIRDASEFGGNCAQIDIMLHELVGGDDCLFLNVFTPVNKAPSKRVVMVWIHGGAFMNGSGDSTIYGPDYLIRKDIVLVTINYRVGVLGFLNLERESAPGNQGLKDQVMALKWIKENISSFGGDPDNVTIFGESAGAASVHYLTISPLARGLFHKAISQSGVATNPWAMAMENPIPRVLKLAAKLGKETTDPETALEFLRTVDALKLVTADNQCLTKEEKYILFGVFGPCIDDKSPNPFLPQHPSILMKAAPKLPYLLGYNSNEGSLLVPLLRIVDDIEKCNANFEIVVHPHVLKALKKDDMSATDLKRIYFGDQRVAANTMQNYADFMSDMMFLQDIFEVVKVLAEKDSQVTYLYKFTYDTGNSLMKQRLNVTLPGTTHAEDLTFLFFPHLMKLMNLRPPEPGTEKYKVIEYFTEMWTNFAKTGNPTPTTTELISTIWKPVGNGDIYNYLEIDNKLQMKVGKREEHTCDWKRMKNKL